ncbi:alpha/beta hydrolase [Dyella sp. LX-66]|uniref:alpha/beta hydrolase n=1 Tax=unclassified Dyella TaxID=2634549 RepID=UPI001BE051C4|nr:MULTISPECIES: alpha/beta fold hydrolase [unclassified Dyella]MBT2117945.1 alpha/beta hydrolase [Dyella sp. LX-1]MBT2140852.1 alpha/beta hydrolase [Dyella sp. LX-66]
MSLLLAIGLSAALPAIRTYDLPAGEGQHVALHCIEPEGPIRHAALFVHGASFPTMLAAGFEFAPGDSWMAFMARRGFISCGLDFLGFGASSRPPAMAGAADAAKPVTRAPEAARQIALAVQELRGKRHLDVHLIAHSWGTIPAAEYAAEHPGTLASLTLFGPVVPTGAADKPDTTAWWSITAQQRYQQLLFEQVLPKNLRLIEPAVTQRWAAAFDASVPKLRGDAPDALRIPSGPGADIAEAQGGRYPYDAASITAPVFAVYGDYDTVVNDTQAADFLHRFSASPLVWRLRIDHGTHVMHLERYRHSLYRSVAAFIDAAEETKP